MCLHGHVEYKRSVTEDGNVKFSCVCNPDISLEESKPVECAQYSCPNGKLGDCKRMGKCTVCKCFPSHCHNVPFTCPQNCKLQMEGDCPKCHCPFKRSLCPPTCQIFCQYGYVKDERGCNTCKCKPEQDSSKCPSLICPVNHCEGGFEVDENNCPTCKCKSIIKHCPLIACALDCPHGVKRDIYGCPTCNCKEGKPCPEIACSMDCIHGFKKDLSGCPTCKCKWAPEARKDPELCHSKQCILFCQTGYAKDSNGCGECSCRDGGVLTDGGEAAGMMRG